MMGEKMGTYKQKVKRISDDEYGLIGTMFQGLPSCGFHGQEVAKWFTVYATKGVRVLTFLCDKCKEGGWDESCEEVESFVELDKDAANWARIVRDGSCWRRDGQNRANGSVDATGRFHKD